MKKSTIALLVFIYILAFFTGFVLGKNYQKELFETKDPISSAIYRCDNNKFIIADYFDGEVKLRLSDNRLIILPQAISASGVRFADKNEVFVLWNEGNTVFVDELGERTFTNCIANESTNY